MAAGGVPGGAQVGQCAARVLIPCLRAMRCLAQSACRSLLRSPATLSRPAQQAFSHAAAPRSVPRQLLRTVCSASSGPSSANMTGAPTAADQAVASDLLDYLNASVSFGGCFYPRDRLLPGPRPPPAAAAAARLCLCTAAVV